jgi:hypothetical protein
VGLCCRGCKWARAAFESRAWIRLRSFASLRIYSVSGKEPLFCIRSERGSVERIPAFAPSIQTALQRADAGDAFFSEKQRHTGASGFVWSSAVEDDFAVARQAVILRFELLRVHTERAGNGFRISFEVHGVA